MSKFIVTFDDALKISGTSANLAKMLDVTESAVSQWKEQGVLPELRAYQLAAKHPGKFSIPEQNSAA
ncbi:MAG: Cro/CI family transcriptional regulator [Candidatus Thiodiazotropha endolucinida]